MQWISYPQSTMLLLVEAERVVTQLVVRRQLIVIAILPVGIFHLYWHFCPAVGCNFGRSRLRSIESCRARQHDTANSRCKKVVGIEYVPEAIEDAKINSEINGIENTVFYAGDMKKVLSNDFIAKNGRPDVIILDPPRAGVDEPVIDVILNAAPERIVYVSCNPATQARDLALMSEMYRIVAVQPVDMFPHTHHVENVVKLVKR